MELLVSNITYKGRVFPLVGVAVRHLHPTVADAVMLITEESHYFSGGSMSNIMNKQKCCRHGLKMPLSI